MGKEKLFWCHICNHDGMEARKQKERHDESRVFLFGMSGDTELFENLSNIKDLWASEQKTILYIPLF